MSAGTEVLAHPFRRRLGQTPLRTGLAALLVVLLGGTATTAALAAQPGDEGAAIGDAAAPEPETRSTPKTVLALLGSGTPIADPVRFGPALAVVVGDRSYLVDAGVGVTRRAAALARRYPALSPIRLQRVFLTHLHSDHTLGLPDLMFTGWDQGRLVPLSIWGPPGTAEMVRHIEAAWQEDIRIRMHALEGRPKPPTYHGVVHEIRAGPVYSDDRVEVEAIPVLHGSWKVALGYRFKTAHRIFVISGDTRPAESLVEACNGCDILAHEVYSEARLARMPPRVKAYFRAFHTSTTELAALAQKAKPKLLVLYHEIFFGANPEDLVREIHQAGYAGRVVCGKDLDVF